jgi:hypothetical protein
MLYHMRTTIDLPDALFAKAKRAARARNTTLRTLVIEGLRLVTARDAAAPRFRLADASFGDGGLVDGLAETDWERIRDLAYEGRNG